VGASALKRGGDFVAWRLVLERGRDSPEGYRGCSFGGPLRLSGPWALLLSVGTTKSMFWGSWVCSFAFIIFRKGHFPWLLGIPMAAPDSSPRASAVVSVRNPQSLALADGTLFPPHCCVVPWGRASAPAGVAPEALEERECSCKVFPQHLVSVRGVSFSQLR
jgi:hypothetical protein